MSIADLWREEASALNARIAELERDLTEERERFRIYRYATEQLEKRHASELAEALSQCDLLQSALDATRRERDAAEANVVVKP